MALMLLLLYLIVLYLRPGEWIPMCQTWHLLPLLTAIATFFVILRFAAAKSGPAKAPHTRMMLGLVAAMVASHLAHTYLKGAVGAVTGFSANLILYFLVINVVNSPRKFQIMLWVVVGLTALIAVQGIQQAHTGVGWAGQPLSSEQRITWIGIFEDPNDLALAFVIVIPILLEILCGHAFIGLKWIPAVLIGLLTYAIYLTNSRGGMLALAAATAFFFIKRSRWRVVGGIVGGVVATVMFVFGPSRLHLISAEEESAAGRLDAWYYGFQLLKHNPLFGVGQGMFTEDYPLTAHNSFVLAFAELGLVGFFFWMGLLYTSFKGLSLLQHHQHAWLADHARGLQASLIGFCAAAFFLSRTYIMLPYLLVALCAALSNLARLKTPADEFRLSGRDTRNIIWFCAGMLVLLQIAMKTWL